jgi:hypothetical protein
MTTNLTASVVRRAELGRDRETLFRLMDRYYLNVTESGFYRDLDEKDWVVLLRDRSSGKIVGFTALMMLRTRFANQNFLVFVSGDTIVQPENWGTVALPRTWMRHVFATAGQYPDHIPYWMLISASFRTYRFLSVFATCFYPRHEHPMPADVMVLRNHFATIKYGSDYQSNTGIVRFKEPTPVRDEIAGVSDGRLSDPHIAYLLQTNPGWRGGDELVCIARADRQNLTRAGRRMLGETFR